MLTKMEYRRLNHFDLVQEHHQNFAYYLVMQYYFDYHLQALLMMSCNLELKFQLSIYLDRFVRLSIFLLKVALQRILVHLFLNIAELHLLNLH